MPNDVVLPCNIDGAQISPTLRGFGHGWQGQHNSTNAVFQSIIFKSEDDHPAVLQQVGEE